MGGAGHVGGGLRTVNSTAFLTLIIRRQRGKMATVTEVFQRAERLADEKKINEAIDLLNPIGGLAFGQVSRADSGFKKCCSKQFVLINAYPCPCVVPR